MKPSDVVHNDLFQHKERKILCWVISSVLLPYTLYNTFSVPLRTTNCSSLLSFEFLRCKGDLQMAFKSIEHLLGPYL